MYTPPDARRRVWLVAGTLHRLSRSHRSRRFRAARNWFRDTRPAGHALGQLRPHRLLSRVDLAEHPARRLSHAVVHHSGHVAHGRPAPAEAHEAGPRDSGYRAAALSRRGSLVTVSRESVGCCASWQFVLSEETMAVPAS